MPGDRLAVYASLVARSAKRVHYLMFLVNETRGKLAAIFECMNAFLDLSVRKIVTKIDGWLEKDARLDWPPPVSGSMRARSPRNRFLAGAARNHRGLAELRM